MQATAPAVYVMRWRQASKPGLRTRCDRPWLCTGGRWLFLSGSATPDLSGCRGTAAGQHRPRAATDRLAFDRVGAWLLLVPSLGVRGPMQPLSRCPRAAGSDHYSAGSRRCLMQRAERTRFLFDVERVSDADGPTPISRAESDCPGIKVRRSLRSASPGGLEARLKPSHGFVNPAGFDYERWLFRQQVKATGYVRTKVAPRRLDAGRRGLLAKPLAAGFARAPRRGAANGHRLWPGSRAGDRGPQCAHARAMGCLLPHGNVAPDRDLRASRRARLRGAVRLGATRLGLGSKLGARALRHRGRLP
jgi:hypothetical protein